MAVALLANSVFIQMALYIGCPDCKVSLGSFDPGCRLPGSFSQSRFGLRCSFSCSRLARPQFALFTKCCYARHWLLTVCICPDAVSRHKQVSSLGQVPSLLAGCAI